MSTRFAPSAYALLRIMAGLLFAIHGSQKILGWPASNMHPPLASLPGIAGIIELVCGLLIAVGLFANWAAFLASGEMAVAFFKAHFSVADWNPVTNKGETSVLYCFIFLFIWAYGSGIWSIDSALRRNRKSTSGR